MVLHSGIVIFAIFCVAILFLGQAIQWNTEELSWIEKAGNVSSKFSPICRTNPAFNYTANVSNWCKSQNGRLRKTISDPKTRRLIADQKLDLKDKDFLANVCCFEKNKRNCAKLVENGRNWDPSSGNVDVFAFNCGQREYESFMRRAIEWHVENGIFKKKKSGNGFKSTKITMAQKVERAHIYRKIFESYPEVLMDAIVSNRLSRRQDSSSKKELDLELGDAEPPAL